MSSFYKNLVFWAIICIIMVLLYSLFSGKRSPSAQEKNYSDFISAVENNRVQKVEAQGRNITWTDKEGKNCNTYTPEDPEMIKIIRDKKVVINAKKEEESPFWQNILISWFPMILLIGVWIFFMRQMQVGG